MPPKRNTEAGVPALKRRKSITMEVKLEVIKRSEKGEGVNSVSRQIAWLFPFNYIDNFKGQV